MSLIVQGTVEKIATRADGTVSVHFGTEEMGDETAARLFTYRRKAVKLLISDSNISPEVTEAVEQTSTVYKPRSQSQRIRAILFNIHLAEKRKEPFEEYYQNQTELIITDLLTKLNKIT